MDRLSGMRIAVAVAETGGFATAGRRLGVGAPAVTRAIAALEADLGARLFVRTTRRVALTEAGRRYVEDCARILGEIDEAEAAAKGAQTAPSGLLTVTAPALFGRLHVLPVIAGFLDANPHTRIEAILVDRVVDLVAERVDVAVRIGALPDSMLIARRVGAVRRVICASPAYIARRGAPVTPADLAAHNLVSARNGPSAVAGRARTGAPRLIVSDAAAAIAAAEAGCGIVAALSYQVSGAIAAGRLTPLLADSGDAPAPVHLVHAAGRRPSAALRAFLDMAADALAHAIDG